MTGDSPIITGAAARHRPMLCVADVDTRLKCSTYCALCPHYVADRRIGERRSVPRPTHDRRVLGRL